MSDVSVNDLYEFQNKLCFFFTVKILSQKYPRVITFCVKVVESGCSFVSIVEVYF